MNTKLVGAMAGALRSRLATVSTMGGSSVQEAKLLSDAQLNLVIPARNAAGTWALSIALFAAPGS